MILTVARHEFFSTVKRKSYFLVTFGMPVFVVLYAALIGIIGAISASGEMASLAKPIGIVDESGILTGSGSILHSVKPGEVYTPTAQSDGTTALVRETLDDLEEVGNRIGRLNLSLTRQSFRRFDALDAAGAALAEETVRVVVLVPADFLATGKVKTFVKERKLLSAAANIDAVERLLVREILRQSTLSDEVAARIRSKPRVTEHEIGPDGQFVEVDLWSKGFSLGFPLAVSILLLVALMMNASLLLASVAEEKENRVIEVLLSSVCAEHLLFGKVLGLVAAGLVQIVVWIAMASVVPALTMAVIGRQIDFDVPVEQILLGVVFVVLGFVFYGCLLAGIGSLGSTFKDSQQLTVIVILFPVIPLMIMPAFLNNPHGIIARVLSWIPLCSPSAMMLRLGVAKVAYWEVGMSLAVLIGSIWLAIKFSARLFRIGTLLYGKLPSPRQLWAAFRQPA
jgi:ABC-2 type transport system permease protein